VAFIAMTAPGRAAEDGAKAILKTMSDYVVAHANISLAFDSDIEVITPELEKIQFTNTGTAVISRPDKIRAHRIGGYADTELVFDGKTVTVFGRHLNAYTQLEAPGTLDQLIESLRMGHAVSLPAADLLLSNPYETLIADVMEAKYIGRGVVGGIECEHLAFRNFDTDWQIWIEVGDRPIPRKLVITSKTISGAPQYTLRVTNWRTDETPAADAFAFVPPAGAGQLKGEDLINLDEMPQGVPAGGEPQ
jgi:hypothetical protein